MFIAFFITASWVPHLDSIILGTIDNDVRMLNLKESCELEKTDQKHDEGVNKPITTKALTVHNGSLWVMIIYNILISNYYCIILFIYKYPFFVFKYMINIIY